MMSKDFEAAIQRGIAAAARHEEDDDGDLDQPQQLEPYFAAPQRPLSPVEDVQFNGDPLLGSVVVVEEEPAREKTKNEQKWEDMFQRLLQYKEGHGDTMVPQNYKEDPKLGRWARIERLERVGFEWDPQETKWTQMFNRLAKYQEENLHCRVPKTYAPDPELAHWVRNQRLERRKMERGLQGPRNKLSPDRIKKLDELGFAWSIPSKTKATSCSPGSTAGKSNEGTDSVKHSVSAVSDA